MKLLFINTHDLAGGAARAAGRLAAGLRSQGCDTGFLVQYQAGSDPLCHTVERKTAVGRYLRNQRIRTELWLRSRYRSSAEGTWTTNLLPDRAVVRAVEALAPDLVHLHWIGGGHLPIPSLARLRRPLVWTLHDMWPFTGGCHYSAGCTGYTGRCGSCPQLGGKQRWDLSRLIWTAKHRGWGGLNLTLVSPSRWLADCARSSSLFSGSRIEVIPNGLDTARFRPLDRRFARDVLGLPQDRPLVLFGAVRACDDRRKGYAELRQALVLLADSQPAPELVVFGASTDRAEMEESLPARHVGEVRDDTTLALLYSAADVLVAPSLEENLSNVVMEALSCGLPCAAFAVGGMGDLIDHRVNGYLARPEDPADLAAGISWVLAQRREELANAARQKALTHYSIDRVARRYLELYHSLLA